MEKIAIAAIRDYFEKKKPAFLFGNGINLYNKSTPKTWKDLLKDLLENKIKDDCDLKSRYKNVFESDFTKNISYPEMYDLINGLYKIWGADLIESENSLQKESSDLIKQNFKKKKKNNHYYKIVEKIAQLDVPLMTTNFDNLFEKYCGLEREDIKSLDKKVAGSNKYKSHWAYPWNKCFSKKILKNPNDGFAIWHIHGTIYDPRSIHFGSNQYVGMLARAKSTVSELSKQDEKWVADNTWLDLMYKRNLVVIGLGVSTDEIFLRWLLLGRSRHLTDFSKKEFSENRHSLYLSSSEHPVPYAQRLFLETCGFEIIELSTDKELYEDLWNY